jgi:signal transduction histidine kinase
MQQEQQSSRRYNRDIVMGNTANVNGTNWLTSNPKRITHGEQIEVRMTPVVSVWVEDSENKEHLLAVRLVHLDEKEVCQGVLLDAGALEELLLAEVRDLFPHARLLAVREAIPPRPERTMTALPFELDPNEGIAYVSPGWTPLRIGLALAWAASLIALAAVGLGGLSLLNLSERRMRFVSAVTHELRTPLTTLRLYLDMLVGGMVRDEQQRMDYLTTLHAETDRLNRLIANVLDYSKLEGQRCHLVRSEVKVADLVRNVEEAWRPLCRSSVKELVVDNHLKADAVVVTDADLAQQILGNLLDNACKYSRDADDNRVWLRARLEGASFILEVEDRGPGVPAEERRAIFRAFRRGSGHDVSGGVGLGLALAQRWATMLGGQLDLSTPEEGGACFRLTLPIA